MTDAALKLLLIEDKKHDYLLSNRSLERSHLDCEITWVQKGEEALKLLQSQRFDVITLDFNLPDMNGLELLQTLIEQQIDTPVIFVTGSGSEQVAVQAMQRGAQNYLVKDPAGQYLELLPAIIEKAKTQWQDRRARQIAEAAEKALALEQERMQILSEFITNASHEFRTPLSVMKTSLYLLGRNTDAEKRQQMTERIEHQINNISALVDDLVTMARIDRSNHFERYPIQMNNLVQQSLTPFFHETIAHAQLSLSLELSPDLPDCLGSAAELSLAFQKCLDNALRFTPQGGSIIVRTATNGTIVCIEIEDSGIGMNQETLEHAFERFYRADKAHSTRGFGLGLSIALSIIEKHGGKIHLDSALTRGTRLRIELPILEKALD